jgi:hypothetical protein
MNCSEFIAGFSEYYDGRDGSPDDSMRAHLEECVSCRRYHRVVTRGGQLLRELPPPSVPPDFHPRLQHRIYHVEDEAVLTRPVGSGTTGATALAMAILLTVVAWSPSVTGSAPTVELPPIVAQAPVTLRSLTPVGTGLSPRPSVLDLGPSRDGQRLWVNTHSLLYEYSPLSAKYRQAAEVRRGEVP